MRISQGIAVVAIVIVAASLSFMVQGGSWFPWVPLTLAFTSATFALVPAARVPGIVGVCCALAVVALGAERYKYFAPLQFAAFAGLLTAATSCVAPVLARWLLVPFAFVEAYWFASLARQTVFEISTAGSPTLIWDSCTVALMPLAIGVLLIVALGVAAFFKLSVGIFSTTDSRLLSAADAVRFHAAARSAVVAVAAIAGATSGLTMWADWQIDQPCL